LASNAPLFLAHQLGYFREVGINVEFASAGNVNDLLSSLAQGQLQVGSCSNNVGCFNALNRGIDVRIVADLVSAAKTPKSIGASAIVVRKDLWDAGVIRHPRDLEGRSVYVPAGPGSGYHVLAARWLRGQQIDPARTDWVQMPLPDVLAAMQNRAIEVGFQIEPLLSTGLSRGVYEILATGEEMDPAYQLLYLMYWSGIESLGPSLGERFMVAYLRGARAAINAFEYGVEQEAAIAALVQETTIKDPAVFRQIKYPWVDPDGLVSRAALVADAELLRDLGLMPAVDLGPMFDDRYRQFAVQYLGEYRPPQ
jgi:NitT/TauT family transport system substrate-binding protein